MIEPPRPPAMRCGTPAFTVFHTPPRLTSIMSVQSSSLVLSSVVAAVADACVGDDDVQPAQLIDAGVDRCLERVVVAHVDLGGVDAAVVALDQIRGLGQVLRCGQRDPAFGDNWLTDVDGDDVGALFGQPHRMAATLAARRAGDESDLAFNTSSHF